MSIWILIIALHCFFAIATLIPTLRALFGVLNLHYGGISFAESQIHFFNADQKARLIKQYRELIPILTEWKNKSERYGRFYKYYIFWTTLILAFVPIMVISMHVHSYVKLFLFIMLVHYSILIVCNSAFKAKERYIAFRNGESNYYDIWRRFHDAPWLFGDSPDEQIEKYFSITEEVFNNYNKLRSKGYREDDCGEK